MIQPSLLSDVERQDQSWKDVRLVSKAILAELVKSGYVKRSIRRVLVALVRYRQIKRQWPTPAELTDFMVSKHWMPRYGNAAPRLTELVSGWDVRIKDGESVRKVRVGGGVCDHLPARVCTVTGQKAHPVAIIEAGAKQRWVA